MGRFAKNTTVQVMEGLYVKPSNNSPYWQSYCHINGRTHRKSTKCTDLEKAKLIAHEHYYSFKRNVDAGIETGRVGFQKLTDMYLSSIKHEGKYENHRDAIKRHFTPFFGDVKDITIINAKKMNEYLHYRRSKNEEAPQPQTINRENTVLRQMFSYAVKQAWLKQAPVIERQSERNKLRRRPHFTHKEYRKLYTASRSRIVRLKGNPLKTYTRWQRQLLNDVIFFLANTGMRVDEMKTVIWRNVDFKKGQVLLQHAGKVKSSRTIIMRQSAVNALLRIRKRREEWLDANEKEEPINEAEHVFALPNGIRVANFKKGLDGLLKECGFVYATKHDKHALTSLRHTYATFSLTRTAGKRATMRALAMQMGTSEKMIQRHYGHDEITDYEAELRGE